MNTMLLQAVLFLLCVLFFTPSQALVIELYPGEMRCVGQELDQIENVVFALGATSKSRDYSQKLTVSITDPDDDTIFEEKISIGAKAKELQRKVVSRGVYEMCFELHKGTTPVRVFFHVDYKPLSKDGQDLSRVVGKDDLSTLENQLRLMSERITDISTEIEHARKQEIVMKQAGESTASSIEWFSVLSIVILLGTSLWQIAYLRRFFAAKKLL